MKWERGDSEIQLNRGMWRIHLGRLGITFVFDRTAPDRGVRLGR